MKRLLSLMAFFFLALVPPGFAGVREDVWAAMQRCESIQDDRVWLDCTYGAKQPMRAKLGLPPAPEYQQRLVPVAPRGAIAPASAAARMAAPRPETPPRSSASFIPGLDGKSAPNAVSRLAQVQYDSRGGFIVTLDNGQVWHQVNVETGQRVRLRAGARVTITPGVLWTYNLKSDSDPKSYKVKRTS